MDIPILYYASSAFILIATGAVCCSNWWSRDRYWFSEGVILSVFAAVLCELVCQSGLSGLGLGDDNHCRLWTLAASYAIVSYLAITMLLSILPHGPFWRLALQFIIVVTIGMIYADTKRGVPLTISCTYGAIIAAGDITLRHFGYKNLVIIGKTARNIRANTVMAWTLLILGLFLQTLDKSLMYMMQMVGDDAQAIQTDYAKIVAHEFAPLRRLCFVAAAVHFQLLDLFYHIALEGEMDEGELGSGVTLLNANQ